VVRLRVIYRVYEHEGALDGPDVFAHSLPVVACSFEAQGLSLDVLLLAVVAGNSEGASVVELDLRYCTAASALLASHEPDFTFLPENAGKLERTSENHDIIEWINKPQDLRAYRRTIMVPHGHVRAVVFSFGSRLAPARPTAPHNAPRATRTERVTHRCDSQWRSAHCPVDLSLAD